MNYSIFIQIFIRPIRGGTAAPLVHSRGERRRASPIRRVREVEIVEEHLIQILSQATGLEQVAPLGSPLAQPVIIRIFISIVDIEGYDTPPQTFLERDEPADAPIPILERMDMLKV